MASNNLFRRLINIILSLVIGFLVAYPLFLYGRHFLIH